MFRAWAASRYFFISGIRFPSRSVPVTYPFPSNCGVLSPSMCSQIPKSSNSQSRCRHCSTVTARTHLNFKLNIKIDILYRFKATFSKITQGIFICFQNGIRLENWCRYSKFIALINIILPLTWHTAQSKSQQWCHQALFCWCFLPGSAESLFLVRAHH